MTIPRIDSEQTQQQLERAKECFNIITFRPGRQQYHDCKAARVKPNGRLVEVFGISNVFTNQSAEGFSKTTTRKMKAACKMESHDDPGDWTELRTCAIECFNEYLQRMGQDSPINLAELVQFVTLKVSLFYLFDNVRAASTTSDTFEDIRLIGRQINDLWVDSKKSESQRPRWNDQHDLHKSLRRVTIVSPEVMPGAFPGNEYCPEPIDASENPLNFLLPAYETMWRVVLRCFVETRLRDAVAETEWTGVLERYLEALSNVDCMPEAFHRPSAIGVRPIDIAKEALRLYPPSRNVHRNFDGQLFRANIEACHRSALLGGDDPIVFRPERWQAICPEERAKRYGDEVAQDDHHGGVESDEHTPVLKLSEQQLGFMPFANYCTADKSETKAFAMKMIVLLVSILNNGLEYGWRLADRTYLPQRSLPLASDRQAYGVLVLTKVEV